MNLAIFPQAGGEAGVRQMLATMAAHARAGQFDPLIRSQAALAISGCPRGHKVCQALALLAWVQRKVQYTPDPADGEALKTPALMAQEVERGNAFGDCDDMSTYLAALMKAIGLRPVAFKAVGYNGKPFQHVYVSNGPQTFDATRDAWTPSAGFKETSVMVQEV